MSNIVMNTTKKTVSASAHLPYSAYKHAVELATALKGEIGRTDDNRFTVTFEKVKTAKEFAEKWTADYTEAHNAYVPKSASKPATAQKGKKADTKKSKPSSSKKGKGKSNTFDFDSVKGNTKKEKNKALHAMLVDMGIADSRTPEYMSVWNARPWAK